MPANLHFILGLLLSLGIAGASASIVLWNSDWFNQQGIPSIFAALLVFYLVYLLTRFVFKILAPIACPKGCGNTGYVLKGRSDRFRCEKCGMDF
jgi:predicted PurR-regulated permease PerM